MWEVDVQFERKKTSKNIVFHGGRDHLLAVRSFVESLASPHGTNETRGEWESP